MMTTAEFRVTGMTCAHCEAAVREEVAQLPSVDSVEVSAASGRLVVSSAAPIAEADVLAAVEEAGYQAIPAR